MELYIALSLFCSNLPNKADCQVFVLKCAETTPTQEYRICTARWEAATLEKIGE